METVVGGLFNAVTFAGAGFLFSKFNHNGYEKEIKRHNEAMEKLAKDKEKWYEKQVEKKEEIEKLRQQLSDANADINRTNRSLKTLAEMTRLENEYNESKNNEPKFEDYYKPSDETKEYQNVVFLIIGISLGYIIFKIKKMWKSVKMEKKNPKF